MSTMWMVRSPQGSLADELEKLGCVAIGYGTPVDLTLCTKYEDVEQLYLKHNAASTRNVASDIAQLAKLRFELTEGVEVVTYDRAAREYLVGTVVGPYKFQDKLFDGRLPHTRPVKWIKRVNRDDLSADALNSLGSLMTVFRLSDEAASSIRAALKGEVTVAKPTQPAATVVPLVMPREEVEAQAMELIKDRISKLDWSQLQELVAGVLRAMGFRTRISPHGADRGRDIVASRDGLGLEPPRIVVEVKHRKEQMGSKDIRSLIGALHESDRGLFISTGGFSKDARYEADRSKPPIALLDMDDLARVLVDNYDTTDAETRELISLKAVYWPVD